MVLNTIFMIITTTLTIGWSLPFILCPLIGYQFYKIQSQKLTKLLNKLPKISSINNNDSLEGWIVGKWYIGYISVTKTSHGEPTKELYLLCSKKWFETISQEIDKQDEDPEKPANTTKINLWEREGNYFYLHYSKRNFDISRFEPREQQTKIITQIIQFYESNRYSVVLLHGEKGTGKSMIPMLITKALAEANKSIPEFKVSFCDTFKPTDPGDSFVSLYNKINPEKTSPLVVVFEEFDIMVQQIHHGKIQNHKYVPTNITDKPSWNQFFDRFDRKYYPWVILVLTSNVSPFVIDSLDPSYIREGRVNQTFEVIKDN
jgi:hypothetical protein